MRVKLEDGYVIDFGGKALTVYLDKENDVWYIILRVERDSRTERDYKFLVGKDGDTGFNGERVEKIAENEINFAFLNGFLDLSDYEEVT